MKRIITLTIGVCFVLYMILILLSIDVRIKLYNSKRQKYMIKVVENEYFIDERISSVVIYPLDTNSYFDYKIVEMRTNCLGVKKIAFEEDHFQINGNQLICLYKWNYNWFSIRAENVTNTLSYYLDSVKTPDNVVKPIKSFRYISKTEKDSILYNTPTWR